MILINNHGATLIPPSQAHAKSNKKEVLDTLIINTFVLK